MLTTWQMYEMVLLAITIWREARGESREAKIAVGCSVRNRVQNPKWWGTDYISCLTKKWQYSSMTDPKDRQLTTWPAATDDVFEECLEIAEGVISGRLVSPATPGADSYYDLSIPPPKWAAEDKRVGQVGRLIFYNLDQDYEAMPTAEGVAR
jgi:hypothetical protein